MSGAIFADRNKSVNWYGQRTREARRRAGIIMLKPASAGVSMPPSHSEECECVKGAKGVKNGEDCSYSGNQAEFC